MPPGLSADAADVMWPAGDKTDKNRQVSPLTESLAGDLLDKVAKTIE